MDEMAQLRADNARLREEIAQLKAHPSPPLPVTIEGVMSLDLHPGYLVAIEYRKV